MMTSTIDDVQFLPLNTIKDDSGILSVVDEKADLPFALKRVFTVTGVEADGVRGRHAHKHLNQMLMCTNGRISVTVDDGNNQHVYELTAESGGLHIPPGIWSEQIYAGPDSILIVCCDRAYEEQDYLRDYDEFQQWKKPASGSDAKASARMNKIVITGALGHIGSRLLRALPDHFLGAEIILVDNMVTQRYCSLFDLPDTAHYTFVETDVTEDDLDPVIGGADAVVHLAALTDAAGSFDKREIVEQVNYEATKRVAETCAKQNVPMIHLSSTSVYGTQNDTVSEDCSDEDLQPQSPYAETKLREENLVRELGDSVGLRFVSCRFGTIFGASAGMRFHTAVNKFCWQAAMGKPLTVWKTAYEQHRPYLDLSDAVKAIAFILEKDIFDGEVYNVLTHNAAVRDIVDAIRAQVQSVDVEFVESQIMNQLSYNVSNEKFNALGFQPSGDLNRGVADTIDLLRQANSAEIRS